MRRNTIARFGLASFFVLAAASCAEERPPINQVQANALDKAFFVGEDLASTADDPEFYWRNYVIDGSTSQSLVGVGSWSGIDRIRWEVTENSLIARKAYEINGGHSEGGEGTAAAHKTDQGAIVAIYRIESHFDIRRSYNPATGEESNVIVENSSDQPWYARKYMRVDWSSNQVENPMWEDMFLGNVMGSIKVAPMTYTGSSPNGADAPHFEPDQGYFDVTHHYSIEPAETASPFGDLAGKVPTCFVVGLFTGSATYDCNPQEAVVRSSYYRVRPDDDFEPLENTKSPLDVVGNPGGIGSSESVGIVTPGQQGWDPGYGYVDKLYHRFAHVHNIWQKSHQEAACTSEVDADANGTADACENAVTGYKGASGSQCDTFVGKCTIPYRDREIKTIGYWVNKEMPDDLQAPKDAKPGERGAAEDLTYSWNQLFSAAVGSAREVECRRTGDGDRASCHAQFFEPEKVMVSYGAWLTDQAKDPKPVITLCHNPVRESDPRQPCGPVGDEARVGDLRKNFLVYWPYDSRAPWGGIADWNADPLTGQIIGAAAFIMGRSATYAAAQQRDILQVAMGDVTPEEITDGETAANYAHYLKDGYTPEGLTTEEIDRRVKNVDADKALQTIHPAPLAGNTVAEKYQSFVAMQHASSADPTQQSTAQLEQDALVAPLLGSRWEADLVDSHWLIGALGYDPKTKVNDAVLDVASPLRGMDPGRIHDFRDLVEEKMRLHGVCFFDSEAPAFGSVDMAGLAGYFAAKYGNLDKQARGEAIYKDLVREAFKGIAIHEIGHSLGMLHQFASSWDAPNYDPQYWQLRTAEGAADKSCDGQPRSGDTDSCMGPRYLDPETSDEEGLAGESRPGILYFANTSVMEYQIERFGETVGLGTYDQHVMNALYGRVLETMDDGAHGGMDLAEQKNFAPRMESQLGEADRMTRVYPGFGKSAWPTHYTEIARKMKVFDPARDCRDATDEEKEQAGWRLVHGKVCAPTPRDHAAWRDFVSDSLPDKGGEAPFWHTTADAKSGGERVRWFYRWGTNHNAYFHTNDSDAGADPYEVTRNTIRKFDLAYPFAYFRRQNREYQYMGLPSAVADRYFERMRSYHWIVANSTAFYRQFGDAVWDKISNDDDWHRPYLVAEQDMLNLLLRAVLMPEPGNYGNQSMVGQTKPILDLVTQGTVKVRVDLVDGRYVGEDYDSSPEGGGSWDYLHWMNHAGFSTEKALALRALVDGRPSLFTISRQNFLDGRGVKINFRNDLAPAVDRLLGGLLAEDWESVAPWVSAADGKNGTPRLLDIASSAPVRDANSAILFPNVGYRQELAGSMFTAVFSRLATDMTLVNKMRIWIDGQVGSLNVPESQQVRFSDPASGYTYIARKYGTETIDGKAVDKGIASRMLQHANDLLVASYEVELDANGQLVVDAFGSPVLKLDADGLPVLKDADTGKIGELTSYIGMLDATRQIGHSLGYGPLSGGEDE
ncbi:MAG: hypothetical protein U0441_26035 [Polyangiaceae bacterium]